MAEGWLSVLAKGDIRLLRVGTGRPESLDVRTVRESYSGSESHTRWQADMTQVQQYICHVKAQDVPRGVARAWLMDPVNNLGRYIRDIPGEFDRMWETAYVSRPTHETATRRIIFALDAARSNEPRTYRRVQIEPGQMSVREVRRASQSATSVEAPGWMVDQVIAAMESTRVVEVERHPNMKLFRLVDHPVDAINACRRYRYQRTQNGADTELSILGGTTPPATREEREEARAEVRRLDRERIITDMVRFLDELAAPGA